MTERISSPLRANIHKCLESSAIRPGDTIFLHSDAIVVAQFPDQGNKRGIHNFIDAMQDYLGVNGTLILPTFTYSFTKGETFDVHHTPSRVGLITEEFRTRPEVLRSPDPIFSVSVSGKNQERYGKCDSYECFGRGSIFEMLHRDSAWIMGMGCSLNSATLTHYVEKCVGVDYRFEKKFTGQRIPADGKTENHEVSYYVRDLSRQTDINLKALQDKMKARKLLATAPIGRVMTWAVRATDFFNTAKLLLTERGNALIEEGIQCEISPHRNNR